MIKYSEKSGEARLRGTFKKMGLLWLKVNTLSMDNLPDRQLIFPGGLLWWVEMKSDGKEMDAAQRAVAVYLQSSLRQHVHIVNSEESEWVLISAARATLQTRKNLGLA